MADGWERRQEQTRSDVLVAAGALITDHGLEGLTMRKLAALAGVSVATLYNQFGDRDGVLVAFVSNGLDQLEVEFDAEPAHGPIDTTRALFAALDAEFCAATDVWRPIFSTMKQGPGSHGMGEVGDRVVAFIEADFAKAAAEGLFVVDCDVERLARHVFTTRMNRLEKWATRAIEWDAYRHSSDLGLELTLAAVLADDNARRAALAASGISR
ncbi:MAG: TetR/AcrR family transcriptional regulator [Acidimicrobiales bacterium]|tara:strand:+ start:1194 stop:1829 length:636 start_codon:yes stop_codon:yes gene_type:complete